MNKEVELYNLHLKILDSRGMQFFNRMRRFSWSLNILQVNFLEMKACIQRVEDPELGRKLCLRENHDACDQMHREVSRVIHNFLAGAMTLVDHTRIFIRENYALSKINKIYQAKVDLEIKTDEEYKFVQDFRNYIIHCGIPNSSISFHFTSVGGFKSGVEFKTSDLLDWSGWTALSKSHLKRQPEIYPLMDVFERYFRKIECFHNWLEFELREHHSKDLFELGELERLRRQLESN